MSTRFYTYLHCKPDGTPFYVGKGKGNRARELSRSSGRNRWHRGIVEKYGRENILVFVFACDSEQQALHDEKLQIAQLRDMGYELCNLTDGGEGLSNPTSAVREKLTNASRKMWEDPDYRSKVCKAQSVGKIGNKNAVGNSNAKGNTFAHTEAAKRRMSEARKGNKHRLGDKASEETRAKMRAAQLARWQHIKQLGESK